MPSMSETSAWYKLTTSLTGEGYWLVRWYSRVSWLNTQLTYSTSPAESSIFLKTNSLTAKIPRRCNYSKILDRATVAVRGVFWLNVSWIWIWWSLGHVLTALSLGWLSILCIVNRQLCKIEKGPKSGHGQWELGRNQSNLVVKLYMQVWSCASMQEPFEEIVVNSVTQSRCVT